MANELYDANGQPTDYMKNKLAEAAKAKLQTPQAINDAKRATLTQQGLDAAHQQAAAAQAGVGRAEQAQKDALLATRAATGKVLAQGKGMLGGGQGLAMMRGAAIDRGAAEGAQRAQHSGLIQAAVQDAARAKSEAIAEEGKALAQQELAAVNATNARNEAEDIAKAMFADNYYTSDDDIAEAVADIRRRAAMKGSVAEQEAMLQYANELEAGQHDYANKAGF